MSASRKGGRRPRPPYHTSVAEERNQSRPVVRQSQHSRARRKTQASRNQSRRHRVPRIMKTLVPVLETFIGIRVRVELRDDVEIVGILDEVSFPFMNLIMLDVVVHEFEDVFEPTPQSMLPWDDRHQQMVVIRQRRQPKQRKMDRIFISGHRIQYIHFPDHVSVSKQLAIADKRVIQARKIYSRGVRPDKKPRSSAQLAKH